VLPRRSTEKDTPERRDTIAAPKCGTDDPDAESAYTNQHHAPAAKTIPLAVRPLQRIWPIQAR
jgi:hypothetical protein